jgi:hypothetical protein
MKPHVPCTPQISLLMPSYGCFAVILEEIQSVIQMQVTSGLAVAVSAIHGMSLYLLRS